MAISTGYGPSIRANVMFTGNESEYDLWEVRMLGYMAIKKLKSTILTPTGTDPNQADNEKAYSELVLLLDSTSLSMIMNDAADDGRKALQILRAHYRGTSKPRILTLYTNLCNLVYVPDQGLTLTDYISKAERLVLGLKTAGETVSDSLLIVMVMKGLPQTFDNFIVFITQSAKDYTFTEFKSAIRDFTENERCRSGTSSTSERDSVMAAMKNMPKKKRVLPKCYGCKKEGHYARQCPNLHCTFCDIPGHTIDTCRKKKALNNNQVRDSAKVSAVSNHESSSEVTQDIHHYAFRAGGTHHGNCGLLVDTGATTHIVRDHSAFTHFDSEFKPQQHSIELADGSKSHAAQQRGVAVIKLQDTKGNVCTATLNDALYVPSYPCDIFSVHQAVKNGASVMFDEKGTALKADGAVFSIKQQGKLFYLPTHQDTGDKVCVSRSQLTMKQLHSIMGHCNQKHLLKLETVADGVTIKGSKDEFFCDVCHRGKMPHAAIVKTPDARATKPLELVHSDLSGPITPRAKDGFEYSIGFVDDYSGMVFYYFLKKKSDATRATAKFIADVAHIGTIKTLRTDQGGEYMGEFKELLLQHSIKHEMSAPHTPQQNGTAERNWRTGYDMARCLLLESGLPKFLWCYALATSSYIRNRCYQKRTGSTPYELFTGRKPNIKHMAPFGAKCFVVTENHKRKLDDRAQEGIFLGYDRESPAYLIYEPQTMTVRKSRNVKFDIVTVLHNDAIVEDVGEIESEGDDIENIDDHIQNNDQLENNDQIRNNDQFLDHGRPRRQVQIPKYLADNYVLGMETVDYCYKMSFYNVPNTYEEAMASPEASRWEDAMRTEYDNLCINNTWDIVNLPGDQSAVGARWVYTVKLDSNNNVNKYKARFVAKGYAQQPGINYNETFAPTARLTSIRVLMQMSVQNNYLLHQMDVTSAYLNADIDYTIYVEQPKGFEVGQNKVCSLNKSLYGLKQSGRMWNQVLNDFLYSQGFIRSKVDNCIYVKNYDSHIVYILVWVDDLIIATDDIHVMNETKSLLSNRFKMVDLGDLKWFLGIDFKITKDSITMSQETYLRNVLHRFDMKDCKGCKTPCDKFIESNEDDKPVSSKLFRSAVGSLIYAMVATRPDLSWIVSKLSQYLVAPTETHWLAVKRVFRYVKHTLDHGLCYKKDPNGPRLIGYCDSDWGGSQDRRSTTGYLFTLNVKGAAISWKSKRQQTVALSSTEAEYMGLSSATQEGLYLKQLILEFDKNLVQPVTIYEDNQGAIALVNNPVHHNRTKHIDIRYHFIREQMMCKSVKVVYLQTDMMIADCLTKPVGRIKLSFCKNILFGYNIDNT